MNKILTAYFGLLISFSAFSEDFTVHKSTRWSSFYEKRIDYVEIQSKVNEIEIQDVVINRGNCRHRSNDGVPRKLKYGITMELVVSDNMGRKCNVIEVQVKANNKNYNFTY